jgi:hypothetical protein
MHELRYCLATTISLASSACAVDVKDAMKNLEGQPLSALVAKLGPPLDEQTIQERPSLFGEHPSPLFLVNSRNVSDVRSGRR